MIYLSPSKLNILNECPKCFYLEMHKIISRPRGIFSSLPNAIDLLLKKHYDEHRGLQIVPEIAIIASGKLYPEQDTLNRFRNWRTAPKYVIGQYTLRGAIDDLLVESDGTYTPLDFKTKGSIPEEGYAERYYQLQMDMQALMLQYGAGMMPSGQARLAFYSLEDIYEATLPTAPDEPGKVNLGFTCTVKTISTDTERAKEFVNHAIDIIEGEIPEAAANCEYCQYREIASARLNEYAEV